jgi:hypothetical protein
MKENKPNLFIVGAGRCGTTSLYEWLKPHPEVFMCEVKGPNFFGEEPNKAFPEFWKNEKKYLSLFSKAGNKKIIGEASHYFWSKTAAQEIKKFNPEAKIIILLRNPVNVIFSYYNLDIPKKEINLEEYLQKSKKENKEVIKNINYPVNLGRFLKVFGTRNVHIILLEEMKSYPKKTYINLCKFLKINSKSPPEFEVHNKSRDLKNNWILNSWNILPTNFKILIKSFFSPKFTKKIKEKLKEITTRETNEKSVDKVTRNNLSKKLRQSVIRTGKITGKNLDIWTKEKHNL